MGISTKPLFIGMTVQPNFLSNTVRQSTSGTYVIIKEIRIRKSGLYKTVFSLTATDAFVYGRIYRNGLSYGTERTCPHPNTVIFYEDLFFNAYDLCQLYVRTSNTLYPVQVNGFGLSVNPYAEVTLD